MKSIIQDEKEYCFLCGKNSNFEPLDEHHIFGGPLRDKSDKYGLTVFLHHSHCHIFGKNAVHVNKEIAEKLKAYAQKVAMEYYGWSLEDFINKFGKSHI